jgi:ribosomal protein S18 acetylase RimI-like enzyme
VRAEELAAVGQLTADVYIGDGFVGAADGYVAKLADTARRAREAEVWVAVEDDRVLGSVTFAQPGSPYREIARDDEGEFRMLAVDPAARGRGVGKALVELCLRRSRELGYAGVRMSTMDKMTSAHRVYERLGFTRMPDDDWSPEPGVALLAYGLRF